MTAPSGPILFNSATGSDVAASGLGPATAVTGSGASTTGSSAVVTGIDTTGVTAGDLLWVQSSSGRQFSIVATVDSGSQVTCDDQFANTEAGRTWAIGGKRATLENADSRTLFGVVGWKTIWIVELETNQVISSSVVVGEGGTIRGSDEALRTITQTANTSCFSFAVSSLSLGLRHIKLENTNGSKSSATGVVFNQSFSGVSAYRCVFGDPTNKLNNAILRTAGTPRNTAFLECRISHCLNVGYDAGNTNHSPSFFRCRINNNGGHGIVTGRPNASSFLENTFDSNSGSGLFVNSNGGGEIIKGNVFYNNASDGIEIAASDREPFVIVDNIAFGNGRYGINSPEPVFNFLNSGGGNTSGMFNGGISASSNFIELTADPFVNAAAGDFNLNDTAGGGALLRAATLELP